MAEDRYSCLAESICYTGRQCGFRTNHTEINLPLFRKSKQSCHICIFDCYTFRQLRDTGIARCAIDMLYLLTAAQLICYRVLATT